MNTNTDSQPRAAGQAAQITEADALAFVTAKTTEVAPQITELRNVQVRVWDNSQFIVTGYVGAKSYECVSGFGATIADALADCRKRLGSPDEKAAVLRLKAAEMIAEAESLAPSPAPQPAGLEAAHVSA